MIRLMGERLKRRCQDPDQDRTADEMLEQILGAAEMWAARPGALFGQAFVEATGFIPE